MDLTLRNLAWWLFLPLQLCLLAPATACARVLTFDEVGSGTVLNEHYANMGVHFSVVGTGLSDVIAASLPGGCPGFAPSAPNVLSYQPVGACPQVQENQGYLVVDFDTPQNRVAITTVHQGPNASAYLKAYGADGFIEVAWSVPGAAMEGVPQTLVVEPPSDRQRITRVLFGVHYQSDSVLFDNLDLDVVVPIAQASWSTLKSYWP
jgi:hypothetical protein